MEYTPYLYTQIDKISHQSASTQRNAHSHCLTGGVYEISMHIHRIVHNIRLLAIPISYSRVTENFPNMDNF